jgi:5-methylcytosine-specific restriction protein A
MPIFPPHPCGHPGCGELLSAGAGLRCAPHGRQHQRSFGTTAEKGYDSTWRRVRAAFLRAPCTSCGNRPSAACRQCGGTGLANRFCAECLYSGLLVRASQVDHIIPIRERPDLRLDSVNLQSCCASHHSTKSWAEHNGRELSAFQLSQRARVIQLLAARESVTESTGRGGISSRQRAPRTSAGKTFAVAR